MSRVSTTASAVVSDDIADVLREVGIITAAGEPVKFRDIWDQQEVLTGVSGAKACAADLDLTWRTRAELLLRAKNESSTRLLFGMGEV